MSWKTWLMKITTRASAVPQQVKPPSALLMSHMEANLVLDALLVI